MTTTFPVGRMFSKYCMNKISKMMNPNPQTKPNIRFFVNIATKSNPTVQITPKPKKMTTCSQKWVEVKVFFHKASNKPAIKKTKA